MKVNCCGCGNQIRINRSQINQKLLQCYDKTKLYLCKLCRRREGIELDVEVTIKKLEIQSGIQKTI